MRWNKLPRTLRRAAVAAGTLVFLTGSNYCLLAALGGAEMACFASPAASSTHAGMSRCGHAMPVKGSHKAVPHTTSPCCVTAVPASKPQAERGDVVTPLRMHVHIAGPAILVLAPSLRVPRDSDESPPARFDPPAGLLGRAPPLA